MRFNKITILLLLVFMLVGCENTKTKEENIVQEIVEEEIVENSIDYFYFEDEKTIWGADPGLGVDVLHELGYTGEGAIIAYADGKMNPDTHEQFSDANIIYEDFPKGNRIEWHGYGVLSLLLGKNIGTAPKATCYYFGYEPSDDQNSILDVVREVIRVNNTLPEDKKISMLGFSNNIYNVGSERKNQEAGILAAKECREAGIMIFFCGENGSLYFKEGTNRNDPENCYPIPMWENVQSELSAVPAATRTSAYPSNMYSYDDENNPGMSWTQPYALGIYAVAKAIDPSLTEQEIRSLNVDTAFINSRGMKIINPCEFIATVLDKVGRNKDALELRQAYKNSLENYDDQKYAKMMITDKSLMKDKTTKYEVDVDGQTQEIVFDDSPYNYEATNSNDSEVKEISYSFDSSSLTSSHVSVNSLSYTKNENDNYVLNINIITSNKMSIYIFNTPDSDILSRFITETVPLEETNVTCVISKDNMDKIKNTSTQTIGISINVSDADRAFIIIDANQFD